MAKERRRTRSMPGEAPGQQAVEGDDLAARARRGGSRVDGIRRGTFALRTVLDPHARRDFIGFRVAMDPDESRKPQAALRRSPGRLAWLARAPSQFRTTEGAPMPHIIAMTLSLLLGLSIAAARPADAAPDQPQPVAALTDQPLDNLVAFARIYGAVRYFHPSVESERADWDALARQGAAAAESASSPAELSAALRTLLAAIAPTVQVFPTGQAPPPAPGVSERPEAATGIASWEHHGLGTPMSEQHRIYRSNRRHTRRPATDTTPLRVWERDLDGGISCRVPLEVYATTRATFPEAEAAAPAASDAAPTDITDRATRLASIIVCWNVFQHFNPYMAMSGCDWEAALRHAIREAAQAPDAAAYESALRRMVAHSRDGHVRVTPPQQVPLASPPIRWEWAGDDLVISRVGPGADGLEVGDRIIAIDGAPLRELAREESALIAGSTPGWIRHNLARSLAFGDASTAITIDAESTSGQARSVTLPRTDSIMDWLATPPSLAAPHHLAEIEPGIWYIDINQLTSQAYVAALPQLAAATGVILDFRGYPRQIGDVGAFFGSMLAHPGQSAEWQVPIYRAPDQEGAEVPSVGRWQLRPTEPKLPANRVFITDGRAISFAESCMGIIEAFNLGQIVGAPTAGTNGNVNVVTLPGGYSVSFTGMMVNKHDGTPLFGVGVMPTVPAEPTREGIAAGRDELLEAALEVVKSAATAQDR